MKYLGLDSSKLIANRAIHTAKEICQQPELWQKIWEQVYVDQTRIQAFLNEALPNVQRIILTGAGTSAFIGLSLRGFFQRNTGILTEVISSTDLVSHPKDYLHRDLPTLVISFARSGNSPESTAVVALADDICKICYHLIITCDANGKLANYPSKGSKYVLTLPPEANDQSLAMTSSYSGMLLTGLLVARINKLETTRANLDVITKYAQKIIREDAYRLRRIAEKDFKRAVFLGSGPFYGTATESHLKLQELTNGKVICKNESFLGFRHGPKAVIDETTLVVYIYSENDHALKYERDLVHSMKKGNRPLFEIGIVKNEKYLQVHKLDFVLSLSEYEEAVEEEFLAVCNILPAQILGFFKSLQLGLSPDQPAVNGAITRVVEGVKIYSIPFI